MKKVFLAIVGLIFASCMLAQDAPSAVVGNLFVPVPPCRMSDTRITTSPLSQGEYRDFALTGDCGIPAGVVAVSMNLAAANIAGGVNTNGVVKVGLPSAPAAPDSVPQPCGIPNPCEAWLNYTKPYMTQVNNSGVAVLSSTGKIIVGLFQGGGTADIIIDVNGYYIPGVQQVALIAGSGFCNAQAAPFSPVPSWAKCSGVIVDARVKAGMFFATTYTSRQADDQIPVKIFNIHDGGFSFEIQTNTTFHWHATLSVQ